MKLTTTHIVLAILLSLVFSTPLLANIPKSAPLEAVVILGSPSSEAILDGKYEKAIALATKKSKFNKSAFDLSTEKLSLCVALLKTGELKTATQACEEARHIAVNIPKSNSALTYYTKRNDFRKTLIDASDKNLALLEIIQ